MFLLYVVPVLTILASSVNAFISNKTLEGYPAGFLPDCPGSLKPVTISKENLRYVEIYVSGAKAPQGKRILYTYQTMAAMAKDPTMDYSRRTLFYIGGYMDTADYPLGTTMEIFYKKKGYNVWLLDALRFMINEYPVAARAMLGVADRVAEMLAYLTATTKFDPKKLDMIGVSLGGHTISFIAKRFTKLTGMKISRLTGLDPAGPCFRDHDPEGRLDDSDADFVDVIKTNIEGYGMAAPIGHVNIYVNGGEFQPGDFYWLTCSTFCSHIRAFTLWVAALFSPPNSFIAMKCDSVQEARDHKCYKRKPLETNVLGPDVDRNKTGIYYLATSNFFPYYLGKGGLKKNSDYFTKRLKEINSMDVLVT
ncbi:pancreatic lipase-related protein 2-like isoform X2 [Plodia interpunctella]|uniref:pancreatic lipase-related protein 2-like isoform X2 n=1 Tax=Plodia interpunctella TaxID=58824 RepID=UPI002367D925|nr:pancreatic lipase-related protein 2-like isoform X2 [Plodia interpunctella]